MTEQAARLPAIPESLPHDRLVIHCSASPPSADIGAAEIDRIHEGFGWGRAVDGTVHAIGYHFVIRRDGRIEPGRPLLDREGNVVPGAHVGDCNTGAWRRANWNTRSIGVCLVGGVDAQGRPEDNYTPAQWASLQALVRRLWQVAPATAQEGHTIGHRDLIKLTGAPPKACPCFSVLAWLRGLQTSRPQWVEVQTREERGDRLDFLEDLAARSLEMLAPFEPAAREVLRVLRDLGLPAPRLAPRTHTVQGGETVWGISRLYGVTVEDLMTRNGLEDETIRPGDELVVFGESK